MNVMHMVANTRQKLGAEKDRHPVLAYARFTLQWVEFVLFLPPEMLAVVDMLHHTPQMKCQPK